MRRLLNRFMARLTDLGMALAELCILLMMLHVVLEIASRRLFRTSLDSVPEIVAFYYMAGLVFFSLAYVTRADGHVSASLFTDLLPRRVQRPLQGVVLAILAATMAALAWEMTVQAVRMYQVGEFHQGAALNLPKWPTRWFGAIGAWLMAATALLLAIDRFARVETFPRVAAGESPDEGQR